ncbi:hypothetical protein AN5308.2 [Aspergillus nidulans FGSC A4]|uniref:AB hydrolase-1 domain-containing protein n=1 Tax=Emericella nidulans (strain FGSC A4 / ATCC 38163 / CBS 112.46 / NRRL 194 / M139) TaxID=227321 RepID=Q5B2C2_EMENI|nr:hypothetical protein [Aspergillus nidulans FGSC A4]EAA62468.1 hypothetical protein AN5308.2 [Aspergillus nidulans FGSC A4]CBF82127.1 TPA: conserved hypothetical protein [Aspergillus nidulans FGSC A4]|eukprot:XP_662912.1 hypothetical protein AN5308.2 [Aspergillus nidulans FGSC A4]
MWRPTLASNHRPTVSAALFDLLFNISAAIRVVPPTCNNIAATASRRHTPANRVDKVLTLQDRRTLGYAEYGNPKGFPLLYLHGFPSSRLEGSAFDDIAWRRNLRIIEPDRPGYGLSAFQPNRRILDYLEDTQSLADH